MTFLSATPKVQPAAQARAAAGYAIHAPYPARHRPRREKEENGTVPDPFKEAQLWQAATTPHSNGRCRRLPLSPAAAPHHSRPDVTRPVSSASSRLIAARRRLWRGGAVVRKRRRVRGCVGSDKQEGPCPAPFSALALSTLFHVLTMRRERKMWQRIGEEGRGEREKGQRGSEEKSRRSKTMRVAAREKG